MKSKTIILSSMDKTNPNSRGILTIYIEDDLLKCKLRLYSTPKLSPQCKLGIYHQNEVFTANLIERGGQYESSFVGDFNMNNDFYSAIIDTATNNNVILAGGTYAGYYFNDTSIFSPQSEQEDEENISSSIETNQIETEKNCECCDKCASCKYKEFFYSNQPSPELLTEQKAEEKSTEETIIKEETQEKKSSAYPTILDSITPQFKYIFENYPQDETLNKLIPNSKFVKITENNEQYSIGAIYEDENMKYISYAIKSEYNTTPPAELGEHHQWLPLDAEDPLSEGYYLVFQDANDLKILEL